MTLKMTDARIHFVLKRNALDLVGGTKTYIYEVLIQLRLYFINILRNLSVESQLR